jgi:Uma2 family endonuclease
MTEAVALHTYTYAQYLEILHSGDQKFEFHDGVITAMAGGSPVHALLAMNFGRTAGAALDAAGKNCGIFSSDLRVRVEASNRTFLPDATVICGEVATSETDPQAATNPLLVVEVLSESTAAFDLGDKFFHYRQIPSLREYVVIHPEKAMVHTYFRTEEGLWEIHTAEGMEAEVGLKSLGITLGMKFLYRMVPLPPDSTPAQS